MTRVTKLSLRTRSKVLPSRTAMLYHLAINDLASEELSTMSPHSPYDLLACSCNKLHRCATSHIYSFCKILAICVLSSGLFVLPAQAQHWSADFESGFPAGWADLGVNVPSGDLSATFSSEIETPNENSFLRFSDSLASVNGGSFGGYGGVATPSSVFTDVRVSAQVNVAQDAGGDLGVVARTDLNAGTAYFGNVDFELGDACISKIAISNVEVGADIVCTAQGLLDTSASYFVQLEAIGSSPTNLTLRVFDHPGGSLLATVSGIDDGTIQGAAGTPFGPDYPAGVAGVFAIPDGVFLSGALARQISGTFDNVSAVPEPASSLLLLLGLAALLRWQPRSKAIAHLANS